MRDEGPFVVEWMAWYRMLGFDLLVAHNDCTDRSPELIGRLAAAGWGAALAHDPVAAGLRPKRSAYRAARRHPLVQEADWLFVCDADELLVVRVGDGTARALLDRLGRDALGHAIHWRCFGTAGRERWEDGLVHEQFVRAGDPRRHPGYFFKTLLREPRHWSQIGDHAPTGWRGPPVARGLLDGEGRPIPGFPDRPEAGRFTEREGVTHATAQVNHYILKSVESFGLKRGTPAPSTGKDRYTDAFFRQGDRNDRADLSALAYREAFARFHAEALAVPGVRRLHHLCCVDYVERLCARAGTDPREDPRWRRHREAAEAAPAG